MRSRFAHRSAALAVLALRVLSSEDGVLWGVEATEVLKKEGQSGEVEVQDGNKVQGLMNTAKVRGRRALRDTAVPRSLLQQGEQKLGLEDGWEEDESGSSNDWSNSGSSNDWSNSNSDDDESDNEDDDPWFPNPVPVTLPPTLPPVTLPPTLPPVTVQTAAPPVTGAAAVTAAPPVTAAPLVPAAPAPWAATVAPPTLQQFMSLDAACKNMVFVPTGNSTQLAVLIAEMGRLKGEMTAAAATAAASLQPAATPATPVQPAPVPAAAVQPAAMPATAPPPAPRPASTVSSCKTCTNDCHSHINETPLNHGGATDCNACHTTCCTPAPAGKSNGLYDYSKEGFNDCKGQWGG